MADFSVSINIDQKNESVIIEDKNCSKNLPLRSQYSLLQTKDEKGIKTLLKTDDTQFVLPYILFMTGLILSRIIILTRPLNLP